MRVGRWAVAGAEAGGGRAAKPWTVGNNGGGLPLRNSLTIHPSGEKDLKPSCEIRRKM